MHTKKAALLIGINHYNWSGGALNCCIRDVRAMRNILEKHDNGDPNYQCISYESTSKNLIGKAFIREELKRLFDTNVDSALFFFSGHGSQNALGSYLVTQDAEEWDPGVNFSEIVQLANQSEIDEITIILDCCHSGAIGNTTVRVGNESATLREGVSILCSSMGKEYSVEKDGQGLFTSILLGALNGGAADILGRITVADLYDYADPLLGAWDQRPVFKSHISEMSSIRNCQERVSKLNLRRLTDFFKGSAFSEHSLDSDYEPDSKNPDPEKMEIFGVLQNMTSNGLVEPVGAEHMYYAAMQNKSCRLTPLGRFYWQLVDADRI